MPTEEIRQTKSWLIRACVGLGCCVVVLSGVVAYGFAVMVPAMDRLDREVTELQQGNTPASVRARQDRAEVNFRLCSRGPDVVAPEKWEDVQASCEGYATLEEAYRTQDVPPRSG